MFTVLRPLEDALVLADWARSQGFRDLVPAAWHVTIIKSVSPLQRRSFALDDANLLLPPSRSRFVVRMGGFIVLTIQSRDLSARFAALRAIGVETERRFYAPHVSFSVAARRDLSDVRPFDGPLTFGPEMLDDAARLIGGP